MCYCISDKIPKTYWEDVLEANTNEINNEILHQTGFLVKNSNPAIEVRSVEHSSVGEASIQNNNDRIKINKMKPSATASNVEKLSKGSKTPPELVQPVPNRNVTKQKIMASLQISASQQHSSSKSKTLKVTRSPVMKVVTGRIEEVDGMC